MCFCRLNITMASFGFFQELKKVWAENFTLAKNPNSKSPNGLQVQMVDSNDCRERKGGAMLSPTMAVILSVRSVHRYVNVSHLVAWGRAGKEAVNNVDTM